MPAEKPWTMLFYIVAEGIDDLDVPLYMNTKAGEVVDAIKAGAAGRDMYVAYRVIPDASSPTLQNFAAILNPDASVIDPTHSGWFPTSGPSATVYQLDMQEFFNWALDRCPAKRYAIFFWGHSFGPAGLFEPRTPLVLPDTPASVPSSVIIDITDKVSLKQLGRLTTKQVVGNLRDAFMRRGLTRSRPLPYWRRLFSLPFRLPLSRHLVKLPFMSGLMNAIAPPNRLQMVAFQDCWMSTMETAFELRGQTRFVLASQSLVPFGKPSVPICGVTPISPGAGVWNYGEIFDDLSASDPADPLPGSQTLLAHLGAFYDANQAERIWPYASLPFALLDLDAIDREKMAASVITLIDAIKRVKPTKEARAHLFNAASIAALGPSACVSPTEPELMGSISLADVKRICQLLQAEALLPDESAAVNALLTTTLVSAMHESVNTTMTVTMPDDNQSQGPLPAGGLGFTGISIFYCPSGDRQQLWTNLDNNIYKDVVANRGFYNNLQLTTETNPTGAQDGWGMELAFDQIDP